MKNMLIGGVIAGLLLFIWQTLSWAVMDLHSNEYKAAPAQDSILTFLQQHFNETGQYYIPHAPENASLETIQQFEKEMKGKPWAVIGYHKTYKTEMGKNILRGSLSSIISLLLITWILYQLKQPSFGKILLSCLFIGIAGYLFIPYSLNIWYETPDAITNWIDTIAAWGLSGIWLGWWIPKTMVKKRE